MGLSRVHQTHADVRPVHHISSSTMADCETGQCPPEQVKEQEQAPVYHAPAEVVTSHADAARPHDPLDPSTFIAPLSGPPPAITIEFCDRVSAVSSRSTLFNTLPVPMVRRPSDNRSSLSSRNRRFRLIRLPILLITIVCTGCTGPHGSRQSSFLRFHPRPSPLSPSSPSTRPKRGVASESG